MSKNSGPYSPSPNYAVGFGRPPVSSRFQLGTSGNPRGRPRRKERPQGVGSPGELSMLHQAVLEAGAAMVEVKRGDRRVKVPGYVAVIGALRDEAQHGNPRSADMFLKLYREAEEMERLRSVQAGQGVEVTKMLARLIRTEGAAARENEQLRARIAELEGTGPSHVEAPELNEEVAEDRDPPSAIPLPASPQQACAPFTRSVPEVVSAPPVMHANTVPYPAAPRRSGDPLIASPVLTFGGGYGINDGRVT